MSEERAKRLPKDEPSRETPGPATVRPPFDPEAFARESDSRVALNDAQSPSARPTAPPPPGLLQYRVAPTSGTMPSVMSIGLDSVPRLAIARDDLEWFDLPSGPRALLVHVDGTSTVGALLARAGISLDAALKAFRELEHNGIVTWRR